MYFWPQILLVTGLGFVLFLSTGCVPKDYEALHLYLQKHEYSPPETTSLGSSTYGIKEIKSQMTYKSMSINNPMLIRAFKSEMKLELWVRNNQSKKYDLFKTYNVCKKSGSLGPKKKEGDLQTPEGFYNVNQGRLNPNSKYFLSFNIGYPNEYDRSHGRTGSNLMIHGDCVSAGCLAMTNESISEIYTIIEENFKSGNESIPVNIYPFRMTSENMAFRRLYKSYKFWKNLKQGYDFFEKHNIPAHATASNGRYVFNQGRYY